MPSGSQDVDVPPSASGFSRAGRRSRWPGRSSTQSTIVYPASTSWVSGYGPSVTTGAPCAAASGGRAPARTGPARRRARRTRPVVVERRHVGVHRRRSPPATSPAVDGAAGDGVVVLLRAVQHDHVFHGLSSLAGRGPAGRRNVAYRTDPDNSPEANRASRAGSRPVGGDYLSWSPDGDVGGARGGGTGDGGHGRLGRLARPGPYRRGRGPRRRAGRPGQTASVRGGATRRPG